MLLIKMMKILIVKIKMKMEDTMGQLQWSMAMASMLGESCHNHGIDENYKDEVDEDDEGEVDEDDSDKDDMCRHPC